MHYDRGRVPEDSDLLYSLARGIKRLADGDKPLEVLASAFEAGAWRLR